MLSLLLNSLNQLSMSFHHVFVVSLWFLGSVIFTIIVFFITFNVVIVNVIVTVIANVIVITSLCPGLCADESMMSP